MIPDSQIDDEIGLNKVKLNAASDEKLKVFLNKRVDALVSENERRDELVNFEDIPHFIGLGSYDVLVKNHLFMFSY